MLTLTFFLCGILLYGHANQKEGQVFGVDDDNRFPLAEATVSINDITTKTDSSGHFQIEYGEAGNLTADCKGYTTESIEVSADENPVNFELSYQGEHTTTYTFAVYGMGCPGCHGGLEKQLNKLDVIKSSEANWNKDQVRITLYPCTVLNEQAFKKAVDRANLTPGSLVKEE